MTDTAELIARLRALVILDEVHSDNPLGREAADAISSLVRERDDLRARLFPYADDKQISGMSWDGFYLIGNDKSIKKLRQIENDAAQLSVYRAAFDERNKSAEARAEAAEADAARMREALEEAQGYVCRIREFVQNEGGHMSDRERWDGLHGQAMNLLEWEVRARASLSNTSEGGVR